MKLPGVQAWARRGNPQLATFGGTAQPRWVLPPELEQALPDLRIQLPRLPQLPRIPPDSDDRAVLYAMALGWRLAHHAATGAVRHVQPSRWSPGTQTTLVMAGRLLSQSGASPAAYARARWAEIQEHTQKHPKGPTAVFGIRTPTLDAAKRLQLSMESRLVPAGPAYRALAGFRTQLDTAIRRSRPQTLDELAAILSGPGAAWPDRLACARAEAEETACQLSSQIQRGVWVWGS